MSLFAENLERLRDAIEAQGIQIKSVWPNEVHRRVEIRMIWEGRIVDRNMQYIDFEFPHAICIETVVDNIVEEFLR